MKNTFLFLFALTMTMFVGCQKDTDLNPEQPVVIEISEANRSVTSVAEGQEFTVTVKCAKEVTHTVKDAWVERVKTEGNIITFKTLENTSDERTTTITFKATGAQDVVVNVKQIKASAIVIVVPEEELAFDLNVNEQEITVNALCKSEITYEIPNGCDWIEGLAAVDGALKFKVAENTGGAREANITLKATGAVDVVINVKQVAVEDLAVGIDAEINNILEVDITNIPSTFVPTSISLQRDGINTVALTINNLSLMGMNLNVVVDKVNVSKSGENLAVKCDKKVAIADLGGIEVNIKIDGEFNKVANTLALDGIITVTPELLVNINFGKKNIALQSFSLDSWVEETSYGSVLPFSRPSVPENYWATSNIGAHLAKNIAQMPTEKDAVVELAQGFKGSAAVINTINTEQQNGSPNPLIPRITAGTLFNGTFEIAFDNTLKSTKFGTEFTDGKPVQLTGYYKYAAGVDYYTVKDIASPHVAELDATKTDLGNVTVALYEIDDNNSPYLSGVDLHTAASIVCYATLDLTPSSNFKEFVLPISDKKAFDANKKYRLAIVASSSKDGDKFCGAPGSELIVDELTLFIQK